MRKNKNKQYRQLAWIIGQENKRLDTKERIQKRKFKKLLAKAEKES